MSVKAIVFILMCGGLGVTAGVIAARWVLAMLDDFDSDSVWDDEEDYI